MVRNLLVPSLAERTVLPPPPSGMAWHVFPIRRKDPEGAGLEGLTSPPPVQIGSLQVKGTFRKEKLKLPRRWHGVGKKENTHTHTNTTKQGLCSPSNTYRGVTFCLRNCIKCENIPNTIHMRSHDALQVRSTAASQCATGEGEIAKTSIFSVNSAT